MSNGSGQITCQQHPATAAVLSGPLEPGFDAAGNLYFVDNENNRIRKIDTAGIITTVAGTGVAGFSGDGGPATAAQLNGPFELHVDPTGTLYIGDSGNHRVRKVDAAGTITTIAGTGACGFGGDGGLATSASLCLPAGVGLDAAGTLYSADHDSSRIRRVNSAGIISTVAGTGQSGYGGDGGPAASAMLTAPFTLAVDLLGNVYVSDDGVYRIRKITFAPTQAISVLSGAVGELALSPGEATSLTAKLDAAGASLTKNNPTAAINQLRPLSTRSTLSAARR